MGAKKTDVKFSNVTKKIIAYRMTPMVVCAFLVVFIAKYLMIMEEIKVCLIFGIFAIGIFVFLEGEKRIEKLKEKCNRLYETELTKMLHYPHYESNRGFKDIEVATFGIIKLGNIYYSNNYFQGIYKGVSIRQADVVIHKEDIEYNLGEVTKYFDGRMYEFRSKKITDENVKIFSKGYESWLSIKDDRVDIDNLLFNDNFDVFSPKPSEAQALLTNELIEHLLILQNRNRSIGFRFGEGRVIVAINGTRPFDIEGMDMMNYAEKMDIIKAEIQIAIDLVEGLGLGNE